MREVFWRHIKFEKPGCKHCSNLEVQCERLIDMREKSYKCMHCRANSLPCDLKKVDRSKWKWEVCDACDKAATGPACERKEGTDRCKRCVRLKKACHRAPPEHAYNIKWKPIPDRSGKICVPPRDEWVVITSSDQDEHRNTTVSTTSEQHPTSVPSSDTQLTYVIHILRASEEC
jgi:hypothetical protein